MQARRIEKIDDIIAIYNGIQSGIESESFTDKDLMEIMDMIANKDITFYIFEEGNDLVGFGAVREKCEIHKVFIKPEYRGKGCGKRISLWLATKILNGGIVPQSWVKEKNKWNNAQKEMGMEKTDEGYGKVNKYLLKDFKKYIEAMEKYKVEDIEVKKKDREVVGQCGFTAMNYLRHYGGFASGE